MVHPVPTNEAERLDALDALGLIDTAASPEFDAVTSHLCSLFGATKCSIALVDRDRLRFKSRIGIDAPDSPREGSFGAHTVTSNDVLVVEDAAKDPRFRDLSIVAGEPHVRFYAGAPLLVRPGVAIGTLAVMDDKPRKVSKKERAALRAMAEVVVALIRVYRLAAESEQRRITLEEQRRSLEIREAQFKQTETIARLGGWEWDLANDRVMWSDEVYRIHDLPVGEVITAEAAMKVYPPEETKRIRGLIRRCMRDRCAFSDVFRIVSFAGTKKCTSILFSLTHLAIFFK
jgi:hypothetical protein